MGRFRVGPGLILVLGLHLSSGVALGESSSSLPAPSGSPVQVVSKTEAKQLSREFKRAQANELKEFKQTQTAEISRLKASHKEREREWKKLEDERRHQFVASKPRPPEIRQYVSQRRERYESFMRVMRDELSDKEKDFAQRRKALEDDQATKRKEFEASLARQERPAESLWPEKKR